MPQRLTGPAVQYPKGTSPKRLVVLLHGYGANGNDLIGLVPALAPALPETAFVSPDAPFPCEMSPGGRQWFSLNNFTPDAIEAGGRASQPILDAYLDETLGALGLEDSKMALLGFSQGTMMALLVGLRRPKAPAGIIGYSGRLVGEHKLAAEIRSRPPVLLVHGDADTVVPPQSLPQAVKALEAVGVPVESALRPGLGHGIDEEGLRLGREFLVRVLG